MLTNKEYVEQQCCPFCGAGIMYLKFDDIEIGSDSAYQSALCTKCKTQWYDRYLLAGYEHKDNTSIEGEVVFDDKVAGWSLDDVLRQLGERGITDYNLALKVWDAMMEDWDSSGSMSGWQQIDYFIDRVLEERGRQ